MTVKLIMSEEDPITIENVVKYTDNGDTQVFIENQVNPLNFHFDSVAAVEIVN